MGVATITDLIGPIHEALSSLPNPQTMRDRQWGGHWWSQRQHTFLGYISDPVSVGQVSESELGPPSHKSLVSNQLS